MFSGYENYLLNKTEEYFGKRLIFQFSREEPPAVNNTVEDAAESQPKKKKSSSDPHINAIITELNGEEIT